ncbi:MAG: hypothetical protein JO227_00735, partial [Acetobacteraceae bacterium]|nr:hypothetical protein [Acetobacteraceae bacterium]
MGLARLKNACPSVVIGLCLVLALAPAGRAQPAPPAADQAAVNPSATVSDADAVAAAVRNAAATLAANPDQTAQQVAKNLQSIDPALSRLRSGELALQYAEQSKALYILLWLTAAFVLVSAAAMIALTIFVRRSFWKQAAEGQDANWRTYLMQLPLGAPEGSVRALISIYVIVFGLLVLVMQRRLGLTSVEAITGFIGVVITFYFTARSNDQVQKVVATATEAAQKVTDSAHQAISNAAQQVQNAHQALADATNKVQQTLSAAPATDGAAAPTGRLRELSDAIQTARQTIGVLKSLNVGTGMLANADSLISDADEVLGVAQPLLSGGGDLKSITGAISQAEPLLDKLNGAGLPG